MPELEQALASAGLSFAQLLCQASQLVLFGSRAAGCAHEGSDWDLLAIGEGPRPKGCAIDLVWIHPRELDSGAFLVTELAGHVAHYGRWIHGPSDWRTMIRPSPAAAERKARRLVSRLSALQRAWPIFTPTLRRQEGIRFRRDLQRFALLTAGTPVPPSRLLDDDWNAMSDPRGELCRIAKVAGMQDAFLETMLYSSNQGVCVPTTVSSY